MPYFFDNGENGPAQLTGLSTGSWTEDIDITADASFVGSAPTFTGTVSGVILRFVNPADSYSRNIGCRKPGSSRNVIDDLYTTGGGMTDAYCGVVNDTIDVYIEDSDYIVYVVGYFTDEATFFGDADDYVWNVASTSTWDTEDLSSYLSNDAVFAIVELSGGSDWFAGYSMRHPDSSDTRTGARGQTHTWAIIPVDASGNVEVWAESTNIDFTLVGEITAGTSRTSGGDVSIGTTGSYATVDFSSLSPPANAIMAVVEVKNTNTGSHRMVGLRRYNDTSYTDMYEDVIIDAHMYYLMPLVDADDSENERCQAKIESTEVDFYCWGYLESAAAGTTVEATTGTIAIAGQAATVSAGTTISCTTGTVAIAGQAASIETGTTIDCATGAIAITGAPASVSAGTTISATTGAVAIAGQAAQVSAGATIDCSTGALGVAGYAAQISAGTTIAANTGAVAITGLQASVEAGGTISCTTGAIAITGLTAGISASKTIDCNTGAIAIAGLQAQISSGATIDCTLATLAIAGFGADVSAGSTIEATLAAIAITGLQAQVTGAQTAVGRVSIGITAGVPGVAISAKKPSVTIT